MNLNTRGGASAALIYCIVCVVGLATAQGDTITAPSAFPTSTAIWSYTNWYYGCQFEFGCDSDQTFGPVASNNLTNFQTGQFTGVVTATFAASGASFAYQEVDDLSGNPIDFVAFNDGSGTGPITFTFTSYQNGQPIAVAGFATNFYETSPFTATISAFNAQGVLLGSVSVPSVANNNETYLQIFGPPIYTAFVGVQDFAGSVQVANIASVVVSTTDNWFGFGGVAVQVAAPAGPTVTSVSPGSGPLGGGNSITIAGTGFTGATGVTVGGAAATNVLVVSDTAIAATAPAGMAGPASVIVTTPSGSNAANALYSYVTSQSAPPLQILSMSPVTLQVVPNESPVASEVVGVLANQVGPAWQATTATPWLTLTQAQGSFPGALTAIANATGMAAGSYKGSIAVSSVDPISGLHVTGAVPVTMTVMPPAALTTSVAALPSAYGYAVGSGAGYDIQIGPAGLPFTAKTSADSSAWLSISQTSGVAPGTIHVVVDPSKATYGIYQDSLVITSPGAPNSPLAIPVRMTVSSFVPILPQQVNSATGAGPDHTVAPNEIVSLFLSDFTCSTQPVVSINGTAVGWSSWSSGQINYTVPATVTPASTLSVACNGATAWSFNGLSVAASVPGIFTTSGSGTGQAAAVNTDGTVNSSGNAESRGTKVSIYVTGFGAYSPGMGGGQVLAGTVTAQIGGVPATVQYAGAATGITNGLQQIDLMIPATSPVGGSVPVLLSVNGTPAQTTATIAVK